jgi:hypothetical protein
MAVMHWWGSTWEVGMARQRWEALFFHGDFNRNLWWFSRFFFMGIQWDLNGN